MLDLSREQLANSREALEIRTLEELRAATIAMVQQTRRTISIFGRSLEPAVYDDSALVDAVKNLILERRRTRLRVLVQNTSLATQRRHAMVEMAKRLSSFIEIRLTSREHTKYNAAFVVSDITGVIYRSYADRYEGTIHFNEPAQANELSTFFNEAWEHGSVDPNLRQMHI